jgi:hypothetical protein
MSSRSAKRHVERVVEGDVGSEAPRPFEQPNMARTPQRHIGQVVERRACRRLPELSEHDRAAKHVADLRVDQMRGPQRLPSADEPLS